MQLKKYYKVSASINAKSKQDSTVSEQEDINITTDPVLIIKRAIENARPLMALEKVKVGSVEYLVPKPITVTASQFRGNVTHNFLPTLAIIIKIPISEIQSTLSFHLSQE